MNVLIVAPGRVPYEKEIHGLQEMQAVVGGLIQAIYPYKESVALVCNEESLLLGLPFNRSVEGGYGGVCGTFFLCGIEADNFCSLTPEQVQIYKKKFHHAELLIGVKGDELITMKVPPCRKDRPPDRRHPPDPRER